MTQSGKTPSPVDGQQFEHRLVHDYFVRFHMSVILAAVIVSGVLASKCLMELGFSLRFRYPMAIVASYGVFLLLVRVWIWYVSIRTRAGFRFASLNIDGGRGSGGSFGFGGGSGGSGSSSGFSGFGGGDSGGGGASGSWEANEAAAVVAQPAPAPSGSHWWPDLDLGGGGGDDDSWLVIVLLIALVLCIFGGGVYLVYAAPHILPEAACQVVLAGSMTRVSKQPHHNWMTGVVWSTWIPFVLVLLMAGVLGWKAHSYCPAALRLIDLLHCPVK